MVIWLSQYVSDCLERISESHIQVNGIHSESNGIEIFLENIIQAPSQVSVNVQMLESSPFSAELYSPLEFAQLMRKVVRCNAFSTEINP